MPADVPEKQSLSTMAKELRKTQQQLSLPELELAVAPPGSPDTDDSPVGEARGEELFSLQEAPAAAADSRKTPRKRVTKPKMVLVSESTLDRMAGCDSPLLEVPTAASPPGENGVARHAPAWQSLLPAGKIDAPASPGTPSPKAPASAWREPATAANQQFIARPSPEFPAPLKPLAATPLLANAEKRLSTWANIAALAASSAFIVTLIVGATQFIKTERAQRELLAAQKESLQQERNAKTAELNSRAVELFLRYNDLMLQVNAPVAKNARKETRYWKENLAINLLDALFNLTRGNNEWESTIGWALEKHGRHIRDQRLSCATYSNEFVRYLERTFAAKAVTLCRDLPNSD